MSGMCWTRPGDWWDVESDFARLAMALCRVCRVRVACAELAEAGDRAGMIWAGVPYGGSGTALRVCYCGYPILTASEVPRGGCRRCLGVTTDAYRPAIERLAAAGASNADIARVLPFSPVAIRDARRRWKTATSTTTALKGAA